MIEQKDMLLILKKTYIYIIIHFLFLKKVILNSLKIVNLEINFIVRYL